MAEQRSIRKVITALLGFALICFPMAVSAAVIEVDDQEGAKDSEVTFTVTVNNPPIVADSIGFDIAYEAMSLRFVSADFGGTLIQGWDTKQASSPEPGVIRINATGGHNPIAAGAKGVLVKIKFTVTGDEDCEVAIKNLNSGAGKWSKKDGNFKVFKVPAT